MHNYIDIQIACPLPPPITPQKLEFWADSALKHLNQSAELTLRVVDESEMTALNWQYRQQNKSTNVLAFPAALPDIVELDIPLLGDVVVCPAVLARESQEQHKNLEAHWAHIIIHGVLHLLGYDHIQEADEMIMQALEIDILSHFNVNNPY
ncbi:MAG: rRNA maturation RNase YbeY [Legionellaceae bacterium]|nr:rRNA maturation RNase YbeY [Legionellaceae bacterium]